MDNANGILIQSLNENTNYIKNFKYWGINAYYQFPLSCFSDKSCRSLTYEQRNKIIERNQYLNLDFISDFDLYKRYLKKCIDMKLEIRALFIESEYPYEIWKDTLPKMNFLGYEYCPIPIDEQVITDIDWYEPFSKYWKKLNEYGLFNSYSDVMEFAKEYNQAMSDEKIGDGEMAIYICRVSQVVF